jgi:hypothetical protein
MAATKLQLVISRKTLPPLVAGEPGFGREAVSRAALEDLHGLAHDTPLARRHTHQEAIADPLRQPGLLCGQKFGRPPLFLVRPALLLGMNIPRQCRLRYCPAVVATHALVRPAVDQNPPRGLREIAPCVDRLASPHRAHQQRRHRLDFSAQSRRLAFLGQGTEISNIRSIRHRQRSPYIGSVSVPGV